MRASRGSPRSASGAHVPPFPSFATAPHYQQAPGLATSYLAWLCSFGGVIGCKARSGKLKQLRALRLGYASYPCNVALAGFKRNLLVAV